MGAAERVARSEQGELKIDSIILIQCGRASLSRHADRSQEKRLLRLVNKAKSLTELYKQTSLLVPIALPTAPPPRLRSVISLDAASTWHTSALLSAAIESATLPSRLKDAANRDTLGDMADRLNVHGKQTVANLQMSFAGAGGTPRVVEDGGEDGGHDGAGVRLDADFRPMDDLLGDGGGRAQNGGARGGPKMFSQVLASRGDWAADEAEDEEGAGDDRTRERRRRRDPRAPAGRRYRSALSYPLLDSFPQIFRDDKGAPLQDGLAVTTSLSTDTELSGRLRALRLTVTRLIGLEERETLSNELAEMADEYHEGWSSGSDFGDDD